jgi:hypothetical protein
VAGGKKVETSTISALIGAAIFFGGIIIGTSKIEGLAPEASTGILWGGIGIGLAIIASGIFSKMFRKR